MKLKINVTWPMCRQLCIDIGDVNCGDVEIISPRKATKSNNEITIDHAFGLGNRVGDDDRYRITRESKDPLDCCQPYGPCTQFERTLVIILESPHRAEYRNDCIDLPIGPAQGATGHNIRDYLMEFIKVSRLEAHDIFGDNSSMRVIIANPIQFQTSLEAIVKFSNAKVRKRVKTKVWKALWRQQEIKDEFRERLQRYSPKFILNACTYALNRTVRQFLACKFRDACIWEGYHPSFWDKWKLLSVPQPTFTANESQCNGDLNNTILTVQLEEGIEFATKPKCMSDFRMVDSSTSASTRSRAVIRKLEVADDHRKASLWLDCDVSIANLAVRVRVRQSGKMNKREGYLTYKAAEPAS